MPKVLLKIMILGKNFNESYGGALVLKIFQGRDSHFHKTALD